MTDLTQNRRAFLGLAGTAFLTACAPRTPSDVFSQTSPDGAAPSFTPVEGYGVIVDGGYTLPAVPPQYLQWPNRRQVVYYEGSAAPGEIEIDPYAKFLYYVMDNGTAWRYPIAVGRAGLSLKSTTVIRQKKEWPGWQPTRNMLRTQPDVYGPFAGGVPGGLASPLGARALYLYKGGRDTYYRIHGTNDLGSIGNSGSAGCIRLFNHDIIDLFDRVSVPTTVKVRSQAESLRIVGPEFSPRGVELPPKIVSPESIYGATDVMPDAGT